MVSIKFEEKYFILLFTLPLLPSIHPLTFLVFYFLVPISYPGLQKEKSFIFKMQCIHVIYVKNLNIMFNQQPPKWFMKWPSVYIQYFSIFWLAYSDKLSHLSSFLVFQTYTQYMYFKYQYIFGCHITISNTSLTVILKAVPHKYYTVYVILRYISMQQIFRKFIHFYIIQ